MSIELQRLDKNCNDCKFFVRDLAALNASKKEHRRWVFLSIRTRRQYFWEEAQKALEKKRLEKHNALLRERANVSVDKSYKPNLIFGDCSKLGSKIVTCPRICQPEHEGCFVHRKD